MSLVELQTELCEVYTTEASVQTITWTLQREGYTLKMVSHSSFHWVNTHIF